VPSSWQGPGWRSQPGPRSRARRRTSGSDFQFRRVSVTGVAITGEVINDCAEPVWGIIRLTFRNKRDVVDTQDTWPAGRHTIPPKSAYPVSWYFDIDPAWTTLEHKVVMVDTE
jgi:hypothetical protein